MSLWLVRAGKHGEQEGAALEHGIVTIGWNELPDLATLKSRDEVQSYLLKGNPGATRGYLNNVGGQIWRFVNDIAVEDFVVLPLKSQSAIAIGVITGPYKFEVNLGSQIRHMRPVKWLRTDLPRTAFDQDLLHSFGAFMTVCKIQRNNAENRVKAVLEGKRQPRIAATDEEEDFENTNIEQLARDQIVALIGQKFKGHKFATLVDGVLRAQGYETSVSPPGPDDGIDILASTGPLGFASPKILVQVKSSESPCNVDVLRTLQGVMGNVRADCGLLVSWGGFNRNVLNEARSSFFSVRLWDSGKFIEELIQAYEKLSPDLQADIPLKKTFVLVQEEE